MSTVRWRIEAGQLKCDEVLPHGPGATWCEHLQELVKTGNDADAILPGMTLWVPIFPTADIFAQVKIDSDMIGNSALMKMHHQPEFGQSVQLNLGFWNPGEGMNSIRLVVLDYLKSRLDPAETFDEGAIKTKCPSNIHGMQQRKELALIANNKREKWICLWSIVMENACLPCVRLSDPDAGLIDPNDTSQGRRPWSPINA